MLVANLGLKDITGAGLALEKGPFRADINSPRSTARLRPARLLLMLRADLPYSIPFAGSDALQAVIYLLEPF